MVWLGHFAILQDSLLIPTSKPILPTWKELSRRFTEFVPSSQKLILQLIMLDLLLMGLMGRFVVIRCVLLQHHSCFVGAIVQGIIAKTTLLHKANSGKQRQTEKTTTTSSRTRPTKRKYCKRNMSIASYELHTLQPRAHDIHCALHFWENINS